MTKEKNLLTIKELADSLNLPKNKINYQVSKLNSDYIVILNGIKHLTLDAQTLIKQSLGLSEENDAVENLDSFKHLFTHQIKQLEDQIKLKDEQINTLHTLLDQQQKLTLNGHKQIESLNLKIDTPRDKISPETNDNQKSLDLVLIENQQLKEQINNLSQPTKQSFLKRFFSNK